MKFLPVALCSVLLAPLDEHGVGGAGGAAASHRSAWNVLWRLWRKWQGKMIAGLISRVCGSIEVSIECGKLSGKSLLPNIVSQRGRRKWHGKQLTTICLRQMHSEIKGTRQTKSRWWFLLVGLHIYFICLIGYLSGVIICLCMQNKWLSWLWGTWCCLSSYAPHALVRYSTIRNQPMHHMYLLIVTPYIFVCICLHTCTETTTVVVGSIRPDCLCHLLYHLQCSRLYSSVG